MDRWQSLSEQGGSVHTVPARVRLCWWYSSRTHHHEWSVAGIVYHNITVLLLRWRHFPVCGTNKSDSDSSSSGSPGSFLIRFLAGVSSVSCTQITSWRQPGEQTPWCWSGQSSGPAAPCEPIPGHNTNMWSVLQQWWHHSGALQNWNLQSEHGSVQVFFCCVSFLPLNYEKRLWGLQRRFCCDTQKEARVIKHPQRQRC